MGLHSEVLIVTMNGTVVIKEMLVCAFQFHEVFLKRRPVVTAENSSEIAI